MQSSKIQSGFWLLSILLIGAISSCEDRVANQCEQIFYIARSTNNSLLDRDLEDQTELLETKDWLTAARTMNQAADRLMALKTEDSQLITHRQQLATIYRLYAKATYGAVKAWENQNIEELKTARIDAQQVGKMQQALLKEINAYCLGETDY